MIGGGAIGTARAAAHPRSLAPAGAMIAAARSSAPVRSSNGFSVHDQERGVRLRVVVDEVQADGRGIVGDRVLRLQDLLDLLDHARGAADRGAVRQLHDDEERALVVFAAGSRSA